ADGLPSVLSPVNNRSPKFLPPRASDMLPRINGSSFNPIPYTQNEVAETLNMLPKEHHASNNSGNHQTPRVSGEKEPNYRNKGAESSDKELHTNNNTRNNPASLTESHDNVLNRL